jgi:hypothetical protein
MALACAVAFVASAPPAGIVPVLLCIGWLACSAAGVEAARGVGARHLGIAAVSALLGGALLDVWLAFPAVTVVIPAVGLAVVARGRARRPTAWIAVWVILAVVGARCSDDPPSHGKAISAPVQGVHPGQSIRVVIDGSIVVPFTAPRVVDPDEAGVAGYARALRLTLAAAARQAEGARARKALAGASVVAVDLGEGASRSEPRARGVEVRSGTVGPGSRVSLGCPGGVLGPGDPKPDALAADGCPRKYAADGTAGLGARPRWPGYTEAPGRARLGVDALARTAGLPGSRPWRTGIACLLLGLGIFWIAGTPGRSGELADDDAGPRAGGSAFEAMVACVVAGAVVMTVGTLPLQWDPSPPWDPWRGRAAHELAGLLAIGIVVSLIDPKRGAEGWRGRVVVLGSAATIWLGSSAWTSAHGPRAIPERVMAWSERLSGVGLDIQTLDALGAMVVVAVAGGGLGALLSVPRGGGGSPSRPTPEEGTPPRPGSWALAVVVGLLASRKPEAVLALNAVAALWTIFGTMLGGWGVPTPGAPESRSTAH